MPELTRRRRLLILVICCMSLLIVGLDATIVNVALPDIGHDLHAPVTGLQWVIDAYTLVLASLLMLAGSTADRFGRRRIFQTGLVLFTLGSLLCSVAPGLGWLIAFRMMQAAGGSMLNPVAMSIITNTFTEPRERAQAIGVWGATVGISLALGPIVGGALVGTVGWRSIFWINIPVGLIAVVLAAKFVPESKAAHARRFDPVGQVLVLVMIASLIYAIIEGKSHGWTSPEILGLFVVSALALVGLLRYEPRRAEPLLQIRFFRSAPFSGATAIAISAFAGLAGFLFLNTLYLQEVQGFSAMRAGLYTVPFAVFAGLCAPISGRLVGRGGARLPLIIAGVFTTAAAVMLAQITNTTSLGYLAASYVVFGIGFGFVNAPITNTAVSGMPRAQAGVAAGIASSCRQLGSSLGVAVVGAAATSSVTGSIKATFAHSSHVGWWIIAGCGLAVLLFGLATTGRWAQGTAERAAVEIEPAPAPVPVGAG